MSFEEPNSTMADEYKKRKQEEYEMQLFGFHSRAVYTTLNSMIIEKIQCVSQKLIQTLEKHYNKESGAFKTDEDRLIQTYINAAKPYLKDIEDIVNKYISIPDNVLLEEDSVQAKQYTDEEFAALEQRLKDLQDKAKRATIVNAGLKAELEIIKQFEPYEEQVKRLNEVIDVCSDCPNTDSKMLLLIEEYKRLNRMFCNRPTITDKMKYNPTINTKLLDCDLDSL